jgi:O-antigen ligase
MVLAIVRLKAYRGVYLALALLAGTTAGILLGTLQMSSSEGGVNPWNLYAETNYHVAVGFFANADRMATLLVISIPFLAALVAAARRAQPQRYWVFAALAAAMGLMLIVGLALNGSLAGYGLTLPVVAASALILLPADSRLRRLALPLAAVLTAAAIAVLANSDIGSEKIGAHATSAVQSRADILATTTKALGDFMPLGSGLGSFVKLYPMYEDPASVGGTYVVHAHNDYVEVALEMGIAGIALMIAFLAWWGAAVWRLWSSRDAGAFSRAASIASAAILAHSLVDFPLRTAAMSACFGLCLALLADRRAPQVAHEDDLRPTRHLVFR